MIAIGIIVAVILGLGGTAVVADSARPGDALFGVDQAVEKIELSLSGESRKDILRLKFAQERVIEIEDIMDEDSEDQSDNRQDDDVSSPGQASQPDGADAVEDGKRIISDENRADIEVGIQALASLLGDIDNSELDLELESIIKNLNDGIGALPEDTRIEVRDDRFEIRNDDGRIRVDIKKNGEIRLRAETDEDERDVSDDDDDEDENDDSPNVVSGTDGKIGLSEAEADIFTDVTVVKIEINDKETIFTTSARIRAAIIDEILKRFTGLTSLQIDSALEIEMENRASRAEDLKVDSDLDGDGDESRDDDDNNDRNRDDNSGSNRGRR